MMSLRNSFPILKCFNKIKNMAQESKSPRSLLPNFITGPCLLKDTSRISEFNSRIKRPVSPELIRTLGFVFFSDKGYHRVLRSFVRKSMASVQFSGSGVAAAKRGLPSFDGLRLTPSTFRVSTSVGACGLGIDGRCFRGLVVKAATVVAPKYTSIKPLGDRVLVKLKTSEEKTTGGILLPSTAQSKPQAGEVVAIGEGRTIGKKKIEIGVQTGIQVVYSKYAGTELEFSGSKHLILKEDDIVGVLDTDDVKDLKPLNDRVLIKVAEAEEKTSGGLLLTEATKEKPSIGTVIAVGPGPLDEEGNRKPLSVTPGSTVLYSKYAGNEFKSADGSDYIALRASDVIAVLS